MSACGPIRSKNDYLVFGQPLIEEDEINEVVDSMRAAWLGTGPKVAQFERQVAVYKNVPYAVALNSCTAGLHLACLALGLGPSDEVITTPMTFCATVNAIIHSGATPVLADVDVRTLNINPEEIRRKITRKTRAIVPVHFAGRSCDMSAIMAIAREYELKVIEDCAHAIETEYHGKKVGTIGDCGVLSFYSTKNIVTGEGGMILTSDEEIAERVKVLALHGMSKDAWKRFSDDGYKHYEVTEIGFKYNMMDLQAAIGIHQIQRIDSYWQRRRQIWEQYQAAFSDLPIGLPAPVEPDTRHAFHLYTLLIEQDQTGCTRDRFINELHSNNIGSGVHYRQIAAHPVYQKMFGWQESDYPNAQRVGDATVSLPLSAKLSNDDVNDVITAVRSTLQ